MISKKDLSKMFDHTILKATATDEQVMQICSEAKKISAASVCVNPCHVKMVKKALEGSVVKVCTVIGFPLGANASEVKAFETQCAIKDGADEVDMVINVGKLKSGDIDWVYNDICSVVNAAEGAIVKVIIETCYLTDEEKVKVSQLAEKAGADFVKTSTGFGTGGATAHDVSLMKKSVAIKVKASGGMRSFNDVVPILDAGADRLGVSASMTILEGYKE